MAGHHTQEKELSLYRKKLDSYLKRARSEITDMARQRSASKAIIDNQRKSREGVIAGLWGNVVGLRNKIDKVGVIT